MTHLPYILAAYGLAGALALYLSIGAALRLRRDRARLATLEAARGRQPVDGQTETGRAGVSA
ncbi:hypothetical protein AA23498_3079 [Acetobacter nitrogenifigens DSM 23921 = NBRC 105050]|uniref:Heme exporter protein D n=1 Tax=Acetobacter nitrogenifigens DSM 23921 = NBRC 105050 TaxID=1120919 RepID=A0A511X9T2_9PROT|nr:hypothetical protein [Acetobacter nitrogenifigens]GBQ98041.1 hypothetical protein AA23498_3079 [Acetobacter nitrogenifigens DSM 23921 = NBRC 105050]GEN59713.1 hypothetical protein ANI02nite_15970 [Acetobacter nitrogenifigens DSM 23921 = NBRC 105050]